MPAQFDPNAYQPRRRAIYLATAKYFFGTLYGIKNRLTVSGRENVPEGPCLVVGNHLSNWDPPLLATASQKPLAFIAKKELFEVNVLKDLILFYGAISIDRGNPEKSTFKAVKDIFKQGWSLGMFIEGTRSKTPGTLGQPFEGPAWFARTNKVPIVPVGITGTEGWGKAHASIGPAIQPQHDLEACTWEIMESLSQLTGFKLPDRHLTEKSAI